MITTPEKFKDISVFNEDDFKKYYPKLIENKSFIEAFSKVFLEENKTKITDFLKSIKNINSFKKNISLNAVGNILNNYSEKLTIKGFDLHNANIPNTYISNHRDITLDSALTNKALEKNNTAPCLTAIGDNLFRLEWIGQIFRLSGGFIVKRNLPAKQALLASIQLSEYINFLLSTQKQSIWIAQSEGRSKDGNDITNPALIKMLLINNRKNALQEILNKRIIPISISYEIEPCFEMKLHETYSKIKTGSYQKNTGEDEKSMYQGIFSNKGEIVISFGNCINKELQSLKISSDIPVNKLVKIASSVIDKEIYKNYALQKNNYMAIDILESTNKHDSHYTPEEFKLFKKYINKIIENYNNKELALKIGLNIYANPVKNKEII